MSPAPNDFAANPPAFWVRATRTPSGCWEWPRYGSARYGTVSVAGENVLAHRLAWTLAHGPIPAGLFVCHRCDNPACVRPDHLFLGTAADNTHDMVAKGRLGQIGMHYRREPWRMRGERSPGAKLTEERVQAIAAELRAGRKPAALAREHGISTTAMHNLARGRTWGWLTGLTPAASAPAEDRP